MAKRPKARPPTEAGTPVVGDAFDDIPRIPSPKDQARAQPSYDPERGLTQKPTVKPVVELHFKHCSKRAVKVTHIPCEECGAHVGHSRQQLGSFKPNSKDGWGPNEESTTIGEDPKVIPGVNKTAVVTPKGTVATPTAGTIDEGGHQIRKEDVVRTVPRTRWCGPPETIFSLDAEIKVGEKVVTKRQRALDLIRLGNLIPTAFGVVGIRAPVLNRWMINAEAERKDWQDIPDSHRPERPEGPHARLMDDVYQAAMEAETKYFSVIAEGALKNKQVGTAMWRLERLNPAYRGGHVVQHEGNPEKPVVTANANVNVNAQVDATAVLTQHPDLYDHLAAIAAKLETPMALPAPQPVEAQVAPKTIKRGEGWDGRNRMPDGTSREEATK